MATRMSKPTRTSRCSTSGANSPTEILSPFLASLRCAPTIGPPRRAIKTSAEQRKLAGTSCVDSAGRRPSASNAIAETSTKQPPTALNLRARVRGFEARASNRGFESRAHSKRLGPGSRGSFSGSISLCLKLG